MNITNTASTVHKIEAVRIFEASVKLSLVALLDVMKTMGLDQPEEDNLVRDAWGMVTAASWTAKAIVLREAVRASGGTIEDKDVVDAVHQETNTARGQAGFPTGDEASDTLADATGLESMNIGYINTDPNRALAGLLVSRADDVTRVVKSLTDLAGDAATSDDAIRSIRTVTDQLNAVAARIMARHIVAPADENMLHVAATSNPM